MQIIWLLGLLCVLPIGLTLVLRACRAPGAFALAGIMIGLLAGPSLLGIVYADWHRGVFTGAADEREALRLHDRQGQTDQMAATAAGLSVDTQRAMERVHADARLPLLRALDDATWRHRAPLRWLMAVVVVTALFWAGLIRARPAPTDASVGWLGPIGIGLWAAVGPALVMFLIATALAGLSADIGLWMSAAVAFGPWTLRLVDRDAADGAEFGGARTLVRAGMVTSMCSLILIGYAVYRSAPLEPMWALVFLAHPLGWLLPRCQDGVLRERLRWLLETVVLPPLFALTIVMADLTTGAAILLAFVTMILSGDGRWIAAVLGALSLGGRKSLRTMRLTLGSMACGPTQAAVVAVAVQIDPSLPSRAIVPLAFGAALLDVLTPARRHILQELLVAEDELDADD